jgi:hypothetical protein
MQASVIDDIQNYLAEHGEALSKGAADLREEIRRSMIERRRHDVILRVLEANPSTDVTRIPLVAHAALVAADMLYPLPPTPQPPVEAKAVPDAG